MGGTEQDSLRPVAGRALPVETGAEPREHLDRVSDQVVFHLTVVEDDGPPAGRGQGSFYELGVHTPETVAVLDDHRRYLGVREQSPDLAARAVHPRAHLGLDTSHQHPGLRRPLAESGDLAIEVGFLVLSGPTRSTGTGSVPLWNQQ